MDGNRLKEVRKDHGDTQESLAQKLNLSTPAVSKWEQGLTEPSYDVLVQICRLYNVSADYLLGLNDHDPLISQKRRAALPPDSQKALNLFESYLYDREKHHKKTP